MAKGKVTFVDLPLETQQQIIGHVGIVYSSYEIFCR